MIGIRGRNKSESPYYCSIHIMEFDIIQHSSDAIRISALSPIDLGSTLLQRVINPSLYAIINS